MYFKKEIGCMGLSNHELFKKIVEGRKQAEEHLQPHLLFTYSIAPNKLSKDSIKAVEKHLASCLRCHAAVKDNKSKVGFFSRQKTMRGDCN